MKTFFFVLLFFTANSFVVAGSLFTPATSTHFSKWTDSESGVASYLLTSQVAEQSTGYFTEKMFTEDGRFLWFWATDGGKKNSYLGVVDFVTDAVRLFPQARFDPSSPLVDLKSGDCYYIESRGSGDTRTGWNVNRISPEGAISVVNRVPRQTSESLDDPRQIATHLTFNATHTALGFDCGNYRGSDHTYAGIIPLDGSAPVVWHVYDRRMDHAQMSPTDDKLMLIAEDYYDHVEKGVTTRRNIENRTWLLRSDGTTHPIFPDSRGAYNSHEWWDANGRDIWFTDRKGAAMPVPGTGRMDIATGKVTLVWPGATGVSESEPSQRYLVGDDYKQWSKGAPVWVDFFDSKTQKKIAIAAKLPPPMDKEPHQPNAHFEQNGAWISYTTSVNGKLTLALTSTTPLKQATAEVTK